MGGFEKYKAALRSETYTPLCDDCMAETMGYSQRQQANIFSRMAREHSEFDRHKAPCDKCGGTKFLTYATKLKTSKKKNATIIKSTSKSAPLPVNHNSIFDLIEIGFEMIGTWQLIDSKLVLNLTKGMDFSPALYFFASKREVLYVGKTIQTLKKRLYFYSKPGPAQSTNIRLNALIMAHLERGGPISIFGYLHPQKVRIGRFALDYPAALEDSIIKELKPIWNKR